MRTHSTVRWGCRKLVSIGRQMKIETVSKYRINIYRKIDNFDNTRSDDKSHIEKRSVPIARETL